MKQSLLKRFLLIISLVLFIGFSVGQVLGFFIIKKWFLMGTVKEFTLIMENIVDEINENKIDINNNHDVILKAYDLQENEIIINNIKEYELFSDLDKEIKKDLNPYISCILKGRTVQKIKSLKNIPEELIIIGMPIKDNGKIVGAIFALKSASNFDIIIKGFYMILFFVSFVSASIIVGLIYFFSRKYIKTLLEIAEVSDSMAEGNFHARTKEEGFGEIRVLSNSMNNLALKLLENDKSIKRLEQTRRDYIANVSHELRAPISSIRAISETLCDEFELEEDKKKRYYLIILRETKRLQKLINDMLELSRLQSGEMAIAKEYVNGKEIMNEINEYFEVFSEDTDIKFMITEKALSIPDFYSNKDRIMQILFILIDNAFKFTKKNGYVKIDASWNNKIIKVSVENNGKPIADEDVAFIFDRFYKGDKSRNEKGSGLGLSLAREILRNLGEDIYVDEVTPEFTRFEFTLHRN
ncbi:HAMP domain-containing sensor histidine kinase [Clostridium sp. SM-530-WT-3G]|uniref:ATP-binding protein n=1 Tax=Clostridium sp. SM-530-WT-3G TaxID=2725303 RepID=UPI00145E04A0|nr:HAMP domain-containing histidine kinase [Clostridium sp. SM-530-WT-3G]